MVIGVEALAGSTPICGPAEASTPKTESSSFIEEKAEMEFRRPVTLAKDGGPCRFMFYRKGTAPKGDSTEKRSKTGFLHMNHSGNFCRTIEKPGFFSELKR